MGPEPPSFPAFTLIPSSFFKLPGQCLLEGLSVTIILLILSGWSSTGIFLLEGQPHVHTVCLSWPLPNTGLSQYRGSVGAGSATPAARPWTSHLTSLDLSALSANHRP